ncbi:MAG: Small integral membrane protein [Rhodobacteraceae bacterium HLUCCO18]|nr:MAG: Small integral membrane protein [Rhodobacteraceae bacterium HLUCCO18]
MLGWAIAFLIIALVAALFGFGGIATASAGIAQILFFIFIALFVIALVARAVRGQPPR